MQPTPRNTLPFARRPVAIAALVTLLTGASGAEALEVLANEKASREACQRRACEIIVGRQSAGPPLVCEMTKTWDRNKIKKGGERKKITWGFGDARCELSLHLERSFIVPALVEGKHTLFFPPQEIRCVVETEGKARPLLVVAAPKVKFKGGQAHKVWLNVKSVEGEGMVKNLVWSATRLADGLGIFHSDTIKGINGFINETCPAEVAKAQSERPSKAAKATPAKSDQPTRQAHE